MYQRWRKYKTCWPAVKEKGMEDFINTADEYQRYNMKVRIKSTPKIFILDEKKEIIIKDIPAEELDKIFNEIVSFEEKKRTQKCSNVLTKLSVIIIKNCILGSG